MNKKVNHTINALDVAVIGISGRFPNSNNLDDFFHKLVEGEELISNFTQEELLLEGVPVELLNDNNYIKAKGIIDDEDVFDSAFFGYTPKDAEIMDPQIRLFHHCAWEALEDAGYVAEQYKGNIGLCAAASLNMQWHQYVSDNFGDIEALKPFANRDFLATLVAYKLDLKGPAYMINTACSSSLMAIHEACRNILTGECKMMLAGGVSLSTPQKQGYRYEDGMIMSSDGHLRPFDMDSNGAVGGSGVGVVLLKSLKNAMMDGDHIYAVIKGSAVNNDGNRKVGFTAPSIEGESKAIIKALKMAKVSSEDIVYVETHGTGTKLGDPTEIKALQKAFHTTKRGYCALGAIKANIGHLDVASGIAGFIKVVMMLNKKIIPPMVNFEAPNLDISFIDSPFYTPLRKIDCNHYEEILSAGVSSFGIGGTNVHIILQEYIDHNNENNNDNNNENINENINDKSEKIILMSAKKEDILQKYCSDMASYLSENKKINLDDIAYTLKVGRKPLEYRKMIVCNHIEELIENLTENHSDKICYSHIKEEKKLSFVLGSNQGKVKEDRNYFTEYKDFVDNINLCNGLIKQYGLDQFNDEINSFVYEYSLIQLLNGLNIYPNRIHVPLGQEILAGCIASIYSLEDAFKLLYIKLKYSTSNEISDALEEVNKIKYHKQSCELYFMHEDNMEADNWLYSYLNQKYGQGKDNLGDKNHIIITMDDKFILTRGEEDTDIGSEESFIKALGYLWMEGININWDRMYLLKEVHRVSLPTYPFEKYKYGRIKKEKKLVTKQGMIDEIGIHLLEKEKKLYESSNIRSIRGNKKLYSLASKLCASYICRYFEENGIVFNIGCQYKLEEIKNKTKVVERFDKMIDSFLTVLEEEKIIAKNGTDIQVISGIGSNLDSDGLKNQIKKKYPEFMGLVELIGYCFENYSEALSGEKEALSVLFPDGKSIWADKKYQVEVEHSYSNIYIDLLKDGILEILNNNIRSNKIRILEVGSGNGIFTKVILKELVNYDVEYYFTDIGNFFLDKAKKEFSGKYDFVQYKKFDISSDPMMQGFSEKSFDIVIGLNVVHATKNICESLNNLKKVLKSDGMIGLIESIHNERWYNMIDGLAEGWWYFNDTELRQEPLLELDQWKECLKIVGFEKIYGYPFNKEKENRSDMGLMIAKNDEKDMRAESVFEPKLNHSVIDHEAIEYQRSNISNDYVEPVTELEKKFIFVLHEFFGIEQIGVTDNFFEMGMDSIIAIRISSQLQKMGYRVKIEDLLKYPSVDQLIERMTEITEHTNVTPKNTQQAIRFIEEEDKVVVEKMLREDSNIEMIYPLSPMQKNILGQNTISYKKGLDVFAILFNLEGEVDIDKFIMAWNKILKRHTILRTAFLWRKLYEPIQVLYKNLSLNFIYEDLSDKNKEEQKDVFDEYIEKERKTGFKGTIPPLTRGYIAKTCNNQYKFIWTFQHSLIDGWSMNNIINDLMKFYHSLLHNNEVVIEEIPFFDYINWLKNQDMSKAKDFWTNELKGYQKKAKKDQTEEVVNQFEMDDVRVTFSSNEKDRIQNFATSNMLTINTIIQTAWAFIMRNRTAQNDLILGFETSGRSSDVNEMLSMAGIFISVLPYRATFHDITCIDWMKDLMERQLNMKNYEFVTMKDISKWTKIPINELQEAVHDKTIVYQNFPNDLQEIENNFKLSVEGKAAQLNIHLRIYVIPDKELELLICYNKKKYNKKEVEKMLFDFKKVIFEIMEHKDKKITEIFKNEGEESWQV